MLLPQRDCLEIVLSKSSAQIRQVCHMSKGTHPPKLNAWVKEATGHRLCLCQFKLRIYLNICIIGVVEYIIID